MNQRGITIEKELELHRPILIAGFDGWGNALEVSSGMVNYLIRKLEAEVVGKLNPDAFYLYDANRPVVSIFDGKVKSLSTPGGTLYACRRPQHDLLLLEADEPNINWFLFIDELLSLCGRLQVELIISLGSMYDNVMHTDRIVSGIASTEALFKMLKDHQISSIQYRGPSAIHSAILSESTKRRIPNLSLWCHCPHYLQANTHFGLLSHLGKLLSRMAGFELETRDLDENWQELSEQIQRLIDQNPKIQAMIDDLKKGKGKTPWQSPRDAAAANEKIIRLRDFLRPK